MAELRGVDLGTHLKAILSEYKSCRTIYGYPGQKIYRGFPGFDFSVDFHDRRAATPLGPASGPHTQMVQNIILSFLGGGRIIELKTIQILDQLDIPRPCIDARNVGFNVEWSQELRLEESYNEYVTAWVLLKIIEEMELLGIPRGAPFYDTVFDISVGYDLKGISSSPVKKWLQGMRQAQPAIERVLDTLPGQFARFKKLPIDPQICHSATLSTFHGCPSHEIEAIVEHLISEHHLHVIVKMNPTILGYDFVAKTLREELGYAHIQLDPQAFENDLRFDEAVSMMQRLEKFARQYKRKVGAKFTNTLVVKNHDRVFQDEVMYLSGAPLHVLAMNAMHRFRTAMGEHFYISFSAGITKHNFVEAVLCNMKPITVCTDLLRVGGYTRMFDYLKNLKEAMERTQSHNLQDFIIRCAEDGQAHDVFTAGMANARRLVPDLIHNPRYHYRMNQKHPRKIDSHLTLFDCITCNKCLPVCPNAANISIPTDTVRWPTTNFRYDQGKFIPYTGSEFVLTKKHQIANIADFCNECGNCDTFCPEYGGPFIEKPRFFLTRDSYEAFRSLDGFYFPTPYSLTGRIEKQEYSLSFDPEKKIYCWTSADFEICLDTQHRFLSGKKLNRSVDVLDIDMKPYYIMRILLDGILRVPEAYFSVMLRRTVDSLIEH